MAKQNRNIIFTTIAIEAETDKLIEKLCKRYSLKKGEITKLAFLGTVANIRGLFL